MAKRSNSKTSRRGRGRGRTRRRGRTQRRGQRGGNHPVPFDGFPVKNHWWKDWGGVN